MIFDNVAELKRYWSKHIFSLPAIVKNQLSMIVDPVLFMQLYFVGQDKKDTSNIAHHGFYNKQDYIEMLYAYAGLGGEQLSQERIDEIKHRISELSDEKKVLLKVTDLKQWFPLKKTKLFQKEQEYVRANDGITLNIYEGETVGLVGESGCGKSVTSQCLMRLNPEPPGFFEGGEILYKGKDVLKMNKKELRQFRGKEISYIFQDPMTSLNPLYTIQRQMEEVLILHEPQMNKAQRRERCIELLHAVGIPNPEERLKEYPNQFSGGMRQRVMIAMALVCEPDILIADEPTTALDVTIQAQILELMQDLQKKLGMAIIMVTHDLGVIASMCDEIIVMYGGRVCERGTADAIFYHPAHEYTKGLLRSIPKADNMNEKLIPIGGTPINLLQMPEGCAFCPRCESAMKICLKQQPAEFRVGEDHLASCWMNVKEIYEAQEGGSNEQ